MSIAGAGSHRVRVSAPGYSSFDRVLSAPEGKTLRMVIPLSRHRGNKDLNYLVDPFAGRGPR